MAKRRDDAIADRLMSQRMRVHLLSTRTTKAYNATYPLRAFRRAIRQRGIALRIFHQPSSKVTDCDILIIAGEHWKDRPRKGTTGSVLETVRRCRDAVPHPDLAQHHRQFGNHVLRGHASASTSTRRTSR